MGELWDYLFTISATKRFTGGVVRLACHPNGACECSRVYEQCPFPRHGVTHDQDAIEQQTGLGVVRVIRRAALGSRQHLAFVGHSIITRPLCADAWASKALRFTVGAENREQLGAITPVHADPIRFPLTTLGFLDPLRWQQTSAWLTKHAATSFHRGRSRASDPPARRLVNRGPCLPPIISLSDVAVSKMRRGRPLSS